MKKYHFFQLTRKMYVDALEIVKFISYGNLTKDFLTLKSFN